MVLWRISTRLKVEEWERALVGHPDEELVRYVHCLECDGFRVGFVYSKHTYVSTWVNLHSAGENRQVVDDYLRDEYIQGKVIRMGMPGSVKGLHISPFGVILISHQTGK